MIVKINDLKKIRKEFGNKKVVAVIGSFDLFHYEHLRFLKSAKELGDVLVVIVKDDFIVSLKNENRPIICKEQRADILDSIKYVDYVVLATKEEYQKTQSILSVQCDEKCQQWLYSFYTIFKNLRPDVLYHEDTEYLSFARKYVSQKLGIKLVERKRTAIITTTKIIEKIKQTKN